MKPQDQPPFLQIPHTVQGHFILHLYAAIFLLFQHIRWLQQFGGASLDKLFKRYPFLAHYQQQLALNMPQGTADKDGYAWWRQRIGQWEQRCDVHLPLQAFPLDKQEGFDKRMALMLCGLVEEDSRFGTLLAELQAPLPHRFITQELLINALSHQSATSNAGSEDIAKTCQALVKQGFLECLNPEAARSEWQLRVPAAVWETIRTGMQQHPVAGCQYQKPDEFPPLSGLIYDKAFLLHLQRVPILIESGHINTLVVRSDPGSDGVEVMGAVAAAMGQGVLALSAKASLDETALRLAGPLAALGNAIPVVEYELTPGESAHIPEFDACSGITGVCLGNEGGLQGIAMQHALVLSLPMLDPALRLRHWQKALGADNPELARIADTFLVSGKYIKQMAGMARSLASMEGGAEVQVHHVREASQHLNRQVLENLADHLPTAGSWSQLICNQTSSGKLLELQQRCAHRELLLQNLGPAFKQNVTRGVKALFSGASGTGKTLAAKILAAELGMDLYRVDLAAVINKYIGETEKNLHRILSKAESLDIVLLLDEADSLLGNRTQVKSANDRYANLETNYLLQRLEHYQGIIVATTNLADSIDTAFKRRMDIVVPFFAPQSEERLQICYLHLPENHRVGSAYLERIASSCQLSGGQLRNMAQHASLLALDEKQPVSNHHIYQALQSEYRKAGGVCPQIDPDPASASADDAVADMIAALTELRE